MSKQERTLKAREREKEALSLRRAGASYQEVADQLGYGNPSNARRAVCRAMDRIPVEEAIQLRALECARLDALHAAHWRRACSGNYRSARIVLYVMDRRAKLLGLDAPTRVAVTADMDREIAELAAAFQTMDGSWNVTGIPEGDPPDDLAVLAALDRGGDPPDLVVLAALDRNGVNDLDQNGSGQ